MFEEYYDHFSKIGFNENDWNKLIKSIQTIQEDKASVTIWLDQKDLSRWLNLTGKIDAVRELCNERKKEII